jgi:tRNA C32,U32 (ribose-2'-O)-methylase TrmJ
MNADDQALAYSAQRAREARETAERIKAYLSVEGTVHDAQGALATTAERFAAGIRIRRDQEFIQRLNRARKDGASHGI